MRHISICIILKFGLSRLCLGWDGMGDGRFAARDKPKYGGEVKRNRCLWHCGRLCSAE